MSAQIIPQATIDRVMDLFGCLDVPTEFTSEMTEKKLRNAENPRDVARAWMLFWNCKGPRGRRDPMLGYYTEIGDLLASIDGVPEQLEVLRQGALDRNHTTYTFARTLATTNIKA